MKIRTLFCLFAMTTFLGLAAAWQVTGTRARQTDNPIELQVSAGGHKYTLGEVIDLNFMITNASDREMTIPEPSVMEGNLKLFISQDRVNYVEYVGPGWGERDSLPRTAKLAPGDNRSVKATMLFNQTVPHAHLTQMYAERIKKERLDTEFAFLAAGRYWLIAVFGNEKTRIESDPTAVDIVEPTGINGSVWEQMRTEGGFALFLQTGDVKYYPGSEKAAEFEEKLERLSVEFPDSDAGRQVGEKLVKHKQAVENLKMLKLERQQIGLDK